MSTTNKPSRITLSITSGKQYLDMGIFSSSITMTRNESGYVTLGKIEAQYEILEYDWDGPKYETVTSTTGKAKTKEKRHEKTGRKGRVTGAIVGTMLLPGVGTVIGASVGTGKKSKGRTDTTSDNNEIVKTKDVEVQSNATLKLKNVETNETFVIGFKCDSELNINLLNFGVGSNANDFSQTISTEKSSVELLKEYKELLDLGIITEDEFQKKKSELLNI